MVETFLCRSCTYHCYGKFYSEYAVNCFPSLQYLPVCPLYIIVGRGGDAHMGIGHKGGRRVGGGRVGGRLEGGGRKGGSFLKGWTRGRRSRGRRSIP